LRGVEPAVIDTPVQLADIVPTVLGWTGIAVPENLPGQPLPAAPGKPLPPRTIIAELTDPAAEPADGTAGLRARIMVKDWRAMKCTPDEKVYGEMRALMRYPLKLVWFERYRAELYDLREDMKEQNDLATARPRILERLKRELEQYVLSAGRLRASISTDKDETTNEKTSPSQDVLDHLRMLGYIAEDDSELAADRPERITSEPRSMIPEE
jgi:arylsulfatase A-like enzyme